MPAAQVGDRDADFIGSPPGSPVTLITPVIACSDEVVAGPREHGPVCPKPEMLA